MRVKKLAVGLCAVMLAATGAQAAEYPIVTELDLQELPDESGLGILYREMSSDYSGGGFNGHLESRVYVEDADPITYAWFVFDLHVDLALSGVSEMKIQGVGAQPDLRIGEIASGINGYITGTTDNVPDEAWAINNQYPTMDELLYDWYEGNEVGGPPSLAGRATLYVKTTGAVDVDVVTAYIQDGSQGEALLYAPVDIDGQEDIGVPEPASLMVLAMGASLFLLRRRRS